MGVVPVPDPRLDELAAIAHPEKTLPTTVEFVDIAGLVAGASKGEGLGNKFLAHIGETFWRLRLGIGHPGNKAEVIDYVLTRAPRVEEDLILDAVSTAVDCMPLLLDQGAERAMTRLHSRAGKV